MHELKTSALSARDRYLMPKSTTLNPVMHSKLVSKCFSALTDPKQGGADCTF